MGYVVDISAVDRTEGAVAGGKGALLGELSRIEGIAVPPAFCVATGAFTAALASAPAIDEQLDSLARLAVTDRAAIRAASAQLRRAVEGVTIPHDVAGEITDALAAGGDETPRAVRSSATAEDLPTASFAGQHESFLNVVGAAGIVAHVSRCWASLFSERAIVYRLRAGIDHRAVRMAVIVQEMVAAQAAGVLFTADPATGDRTLAVVEAAAGLGEALVAGRVDADRFTVRDGAVLARTVAGVRPTLTGAQAVRIVDLGRRVAERLGGPQDVEWCLADGEVSIVQSRPITTLFPIPEAADSENHVYVSVGHQQMMTEAMRPLGISVWQLTALAPMCEAGGRLFVDVTARLASPQARAGLLDVLGRGDPLIGDALETLVRRDGFLPAADGDAPAPPLAVAAPAELDADPAIVAELIERDRRSLSAITRELESTSGPALFDALDKAFAEHRRVLGDPLSIRVIMAGMQATWWLNEQLEAWLGERNAADALSLSARGNVTSEMGLALLDVADVIRPHPAVVTLLERVADAGCEDDAFLDELVAVEGGERSREAIRAYLETYGMRGAGEIDITRPRWSERPATLVGPILDNVRNFTSGEAERRVERGRRTANDRERELLGALRGLPDGADKAAAAKRMIDRVRTFSGYREYPKYGIVSRYLVYKRALLSEAARLVRAGVLADPEDSFYLTVSELREVVTTGSADERLIARRREAFRSHQGLTPPRVITSDGEVIDGAYRRGGLPADALVGLAVSAGTVEGRARVVDDIARAELDAGEILVTTSTDPSWTPLFVAIAGLVTEVGGLMTHGAVIAREYGLPAVVGVEHATCLIRDGQRIRVNGTEGYVEILPDARPGEL